MVRKRQYLKEKYDGEEVLAVEKSNNIDFNGDIIKQLEDYADYFPRYKMEFNTYFMQVIPYVVIFSPDRESIFITERLDKGGEEELVGKFSAGIGGHINPIDKRKSIENTINDGMARELDEEVNIKGDYELVFDDIIYTEDDLVSSCHLGLVYHLYPTSEEFVVKVREEDILKGDMVEIDKLLNATKQDLEGMEYEEWMKVVLERLKNNRK